MIDTASPTWRAVEAWAGTEIDKLRNRLEQPALDPLSTEHARGEIAAMRRLLRKADKTTRPEITERAYD